MQGEVRVHYRRNDDCRAKQEEQWGSMEWEIDSVHEKQRDKYSVITRRYTRKTD